MTPSPEVITPAARFCIDPQEFPSTITGDYWNFYNLPQLPGCTTTIVTHTEPYAESIKICYSGADYSKRVTKLTKLQMIILKEI
jgi:hypothetical protein